MLALQCVLLDADGLLWRWYSFSTQGMDHIGIQSIIEELMSGFQYFLCMDCLDMKDCFAQW